MNIPDNTILKTNRLLLREYNPTISKIVFEKFSDSELIEYFGFKSGEELQLEKERFRHGLTMFNKSFSYFHLILKDEGNIIGWCGYHTWYTSHNRAELGYVMNDDIHKGKGYMKEALRPILQFGFDSMNLHRIEAFIAAENTPSFRLLDANGFIKEGILREHYFTNGRHEDSIVYSLLKREFI